jgi:hypothetical protein
VNSVEINEDLCQRDKDILSIVINLTKREYMIIIMRLVQEKKFGEISKELSIKVARTVYLFKKTFDKIVKKAHEKNINIEDGILKNVLKKNKKILPGFYYKTLLIEDFNFEDLRNNYDEYLVRFALKLKSD